LEKSFHPEPPKGEHQQSLPFGHLNFCIPSSFRKSEVLKFFITLCVKEKLKTFSADKLKLELANVTCLTGK
jgi:hypothetical protein